MADQRASVNPPHSCDERTSRRPDFRDGTPIVLDDGQAWTFPPPRVAALRPMFLPDGMTGMRAVHAGDMDSLLDAAVDAEPGAPQVRALFALAAGLLRQNYDLPDETIEGLLHYAFADEPDYEANQATWDAITGVAFGHSPKPMPSGSGCASPSPG